MKTIVLSHMLQNINDFNFSLDAFGERSGLTIQRKLFTWAEAWSELLSTALNMRGPDVSEIGTTWLGSLIGMQAVRPFAPMELRRLGGARAFAESSWQSCLLPDDSKVWAIPWYLDVMLLFYRRDWLAKAGVAEATAFSSPEHLHDTLRSLKNCGYTYPLCLQTVENRLVHHLATWIWSCGGDLRTPDGKKLALLEPEARRGALDYFRLHEYKDPANYLRTEIDAFQDFLAGKGGVSIMGGQTYFTVLKGQIACLPEVKENLGIAAYLNVPYVGGSNLVVWRHTLHDHDAMDLVNYLSSLEFMLKVFEYTNYFPARHSFLQELPIQNDPILPVMQQILQTGRTIRGFYRWAGVEARLVIMLNELWQDLSRQPDVNLEKEVERRFVDTIEKLERTILVDWR